MSLYTKLDDKTIRQIAQQFDIGLIMDWKVLIGGAENTNHYLNTPKGQYVLTLCERQPKEESIILANTLQHLENHGFTTTQLIINKKGEKISFYQKKPVLLKRYIEGTVLEIFDLQLLEKTGQRIAQLNRVPIPDFLPTQFSYGEQFFHQITKLEKQNDFTIWLEKMHQFIIKNLHPDLPRAFVHGDIFGSNVIIAKGNNPIIIDFEQACNYYRVFDIGMAIVGLCRENGQLVWSKAKRLVAGYQSITQLTPIEKEKLNAFIIYGATATAFWRYRQFNIIAPIETRKESYKKMCAIANQVLEENYSVV